MKGFTAFTLLLAGSAAMSQDLAAMSSQQIADTISVMVQKGPETHADQVKLLWLLVQRSAQSDSTAHKVTRPVAEKVMLQDELDPRSKFAYGYFRAKESWDTIDPILHRRRLDEGRRHVTEALIMGAKDPTFLFDAGIFAIALPTEADTQREGMNALVICHRILGENFGKLPKERQSEWFVAMASGFDILGLNEIARDYFRIGSALAPETVSGRKASTWLKANGAD